MPKKRDFVLDACVPDICLRSVVRGKSAKLASKLTRHLCMRILGNLISALTMMRRKNISTTPSTSSSTLMSNSGATSKSSMILPVYLSHASNPDNKRLVYALLDTHSDATFLLEKTRKALAISENPVKLMLTTMYAENMLVDSCKVQGLRVRGFNSEKRIPLPETYTRKIMPANRLHIPTPEIARKWSHLEAIADELLPLNDCEVGLLIGYNCSKALVPRVPRDVIVPADDGPYGQRTDLGWGIVGIVDSCTQGIDIRDPIGTSHRIVLRDVHIATKPDLSNHTTNRVAFYIRNRVKCYVFTPSCDIINSIYDIVHD